MVAVLLSLPCLAGAAETKAEGDALVKAAQLPASVGQGVSSAGEGWKSEPKYEVKAAGIAVKLDEAGNLLSCLIGEKRSERAFAGQTTLEDCKIVGKVETEKSSHGVCEFTRRMNGQAFKTVTDLPYTLRDFDVAGQIKYEYIIQHSV